MSTPPPSRESNRGAMAAQTGDERVLPGQRTVAEPLRQLARLIAESPHNLVARGERPHVLERHIVECDALADAISPHGRWLDLGTGGGLPGLVLAWRHRATAWTLLDATRKKTEAVEAFAGALELDNVHVVWGRAEEQGHAIEHRGGYDGVVARAVAPTVTLVELARGFLRDGAVLVAVKGRGWADEIEGARTALQRLRLEVVHSQRLPTTARESWVVTMRADGAPPDGFPRAPGRPARDPLGSRDVSRETRPLGG